MTALSANASVKGTGSAPRNLYEHGVAASSHCYQGAILVSDASGFIAPGTSAPSLKCVGVCLEEADNSSGANGDIDVKYRAGEYKFANDGGTPVVQADLGRDCYILDDATVTGDATGRSVCGKVTKVESDGVTVMIAGYLEP